MSRDRAALKFVRALLAGHAAIVRGGRYHAGSAALGQAAVQSLVSNGVLAAADNTVIASRSARGWVRRQMCEADGFGVQHRVIAPRQGTAVNLAESPLTRLAGGGGEAAFLLPHQVEAGERFRRMFERAALQGRTTMSYDATRVAGSRGTSRGDLSDLAVDARRAIDRVYAALPADCTGVLVDVCGLLKGLQAVELERQWPRRSAKLVLRIALEQLAKHFGLSPSATGPANGSARHWRDPAAVALVPEGLD